MNTYTVCTRLSLFVQMAMMLAFAAIPLVMAVNGKAGLVSFIFGIATLYGIYAALRSVHTIRVGSDGTVRFERLLGTIRVELRDISVLEGFRKNEYDGMVWKMRVRYRGSTVTVPFFPGAPEFISAVRALEPCVRVHGEWPTLDPWGTAA